MTSLTRNVILAGVVAVATLAIASQGASLLVVNGIRSPNGVIQSDEKTYISLDALKAAGAEVSVNDARVSVQFKPLNDKLQVNAAEGTIGEWVQNQGWRVKVYSVTPCKSPFGKGGGFAVKFEFRNLSGKPMNFGASGLKGMQIFDQNGTALRYSVSSFKNLYKAAAPGGGYTDEILFGLDAGDTKPLTDPSKLLIIFGQSGKNHFRDIRIDLGGK